MSDWQTRYEAALMNTYGTPPLLLERGDGPYVWDQNGRRYLDLLGGIAVNALGHNHPALVTAVSDQLATLGHVSNLVTSEPQIRLAERLLELLGTTDGRVFFANSGTEANEAAFKLTRKTGRRRIVAAEGAFHGRTMGALALTHKEAARLPFEPLPGDVTWVPFGDVEALAAAVDDTVAAVLLEPIQGEAGVIDPPEGYLGEARLIASRAGALLWFDEIQTGAGRTGEWFAHTAGGVTPDLLTLAKGLGGGLPIGACIALGDAGGLFGPGDHGTTFGGNPVATRAALTVLDVIDSEGLLDNVQRIGARLRDGLEAHPRVRATSGRGLLIGVVLDGVDAKALQATLVAHGVYLNAPTADRLRLAPPLNLTAEQADEAVAAITAALDAVGDLP